LVSEEMLSVRRLASCAALAIFVSSCFKSIFSFQLSAFSCQLMADD
jgi:hypothetical protein